MSELNQIIVFPSNCARKLGNICSICQCYLQNYNALRYCKCNIYSHPLCMLNHFNTLQYQNSSKVMVCSECHSSFDISFKAYSKVQFQKMLHLNIYLIVLMALLTCCILFGVDSLLFAFSTKSVTKQIAIIGFIISLAILMIGFISYCINFPRRQMYTITEVVPKNVKCEVSAFEGINTVCINTQKAFLQID